MKRNHDEANKKSHRRRARWPVDYLVGFETVSMVRKLDWRWRLAARLAEEGRRLSQIPDAWLRAAVQYQYAKAAGHWIRRSRRGERYEAIAAAYALHKQPGRARDMIDALLSAGLTSEKIAIELEQVPNVVEAYEALFFQVRDRLQTCRTWVVGQLYGHQLFHSLPIDFGLMIRILGFYGGQHAALMIHRAFPEDQLRLCLEPADLTNPDRITIKMLYLVFQPGKEPSRLLDLWTDIRNIHRQKQVLEKLDIDGIPARTVMLGDAATLPPEPLIGISQEDFRSLTTAANGGDQDALAKLKAVLDSSPTIWSKLGDVSQHSEAALLDLASGGNQAVRESIRRQLDSLRSELGHDTADLLARMGIDRVVLSWLQLHLAERNLANAAPGSPLASFWLRWQQQASNIHANAMRSLKTVQRCIPGTEGKPKLKVVC